MPLNPSDFAKLQEIQRLNTQLEDDLKNLRVFRKYLSAVDKRQQRLAALYEADWLRLTESKALDAAQRQAVEALVPKGRYSIFWQDTVWNALDDLRTESVNLLKALAKRL